MVAYTLTVLGVPNIINNIIHIIYNNKIKYYFIITLFKNKNYMILLSCKKKIKCLFIHFN